MLMQMLLSSFLFVFNASDNFFEEFSDNKLNKIGIWIEIAQDDLNASSDVIGPDPVPGRVLRKISKSLSIPF